MLLLTSTDKIQLVTSAAVPVDTVASWVDASNNAAPPVVQDPMGTQVAAITTAATTDIVAAPAANEIRNVKEMMVRNKSAGTPVDVTVVFNRSATGYELIKATLMPGETLEYVQGVGFFVAATSRLVALKRVTADVTNATTSFADVTGLTVPVKAGKHYAFVTHLYHIENASTTGARFAVNGPAMTNMRVNGMGVFSGSLTAAVMMSQVADINTLDTAVPGATLGSATTPQVALWQMSGWVNPSADGTFAIRFQSEVAVASGVIVKAGSWMQFLETDN